MCGDGGFGADIGGQTEISVGDFLGHLVPAKHVGIDLVAQRAGALMLDLGGSEVQRGLILHESLGREHRQSQRRQQHTDENHGYGMLLGGRDRGHFGGDGPGGKGDGEHRASTGGGFHVDKMLIGAIGAHDGAFVTRLPLQARGSSRAEAASQPAARLGVSRTGCGPVVNAAASCVNSLARTRRRP